MASLWEIDERLMNYQMEFDSDGVWVNEDEYNAIQMDKSEKIENTALVIKNKQYLLEALKNEKKSLDERIKVLTNEIDRLKQKVGFSLGYKPFETSKCKISFRKSESVVVTDEDKIPKKYFKTEKVAKLMKDEVKKYLKGIQGSGKNCKWAKLEEKQNLQLK